MDFEGCFLYAGRLKVNLYHSNVTNVRVQRHANCIKSRTNSSPYHGYDIFVSTTAFLSKND
jgi:hypothetical protein